MDYQEILELQPPHGFLVAQGKQTAIARIEPLESQKSYLVVSNGEAYGVAEFEQPAQIKTKEFDNDEWFEQHRIIQRERRQWWPDSDLFYIYRIKNFEPFETVKLFENGEVIDEPRLTSEQWQIVSRAKELPKQITIDENFISLTTSHIALCGDSSFYNREVKPVMDATFNKQISVESAGPDDEIIPIYSLALVRNPRMRVLKKSPEATKQVEVEIEVEEPEGNDMPYRIRERDGEYCVMKVNEDETETVEKCHPDMEMARSHLAALNINVTAEEENAVHTDKPKKKPKKEYEEVSELEEIVYSETQPDNIGFMAKMKRIAKMISDAVMLVEKEEKEVETDILTSNYGIAQKEVNGELWHFTWSTNAFEDREKEIFSTNSLKQYVEKSSKQDDKGYFNFWHMAGTDFARKEWQMVIGRFLVEAGPYLDDKKGQAAKEFFSQYSMSHPEIAPEGWGCSPEFRYLPEERATGVYENIWITRTSTLPKMAAANIWTESNQIMRSKMAITDYSEEQITAAIKIFKDEDFLKAIIAKGENMTAELERAGVNNKEKKEEEQPQEPEAVQLNIDMEALAAEVGKQFGANLEPITEALSAMATELKELKEWRTQQEKDKEVKALTESPRFIFNMQRASEAENTVVTGDDTLNKPTETKAGESDDPFSRIFNK